MADELTWVAVADIVKVDKNADGSRTITGVMSNPKTDLDAQVMDPVFLQRAAKDWFTKRANIREMHQPLAVGKGKELVEDPNGFLVLTSKIVEPLTVKKIDEGILSGYSVGIKNARIVRDATAPNGRIVDGTMVECSLVDYPASDVGKFTIAKAASPDEDTGALALTEDELKAVDAELTKAPANPSLAPTAAPAAAGADPQKQTAAPQNGDSPSQVTTAAPAAAGAAPGTTTTTPPAGAGAQPSAVATAAPGAAGKSPADAANLAATARAAALVIFPTATEEQLTALAKAWVDSTSTNQFSKPLPSESVADPKAVDVDAGVSATAADKQQGRAGDEGDTTTPQKLTAQELAGSGALKVALAEATKSAEFSALVADVAKAALPDLVKAAVQEATKGFEDRVAKLEKAPMPSGPYRGSAKDFALNDTITDGKFAVEKAAHPVKAKLEEMALSNDPTKRAAAQVALAAFVD